MLDKDVIAGVWECWYIRMTAKGVAVIEPIGLEGWSTIVRLRRRDPAVDNPEVLGYRLVTTLGEQGARELLQVLRRSDEDRVAVIGLSPKTVKTHLSAVLKTLGVSNRTQAALAAHRFLTT